jgi:hypothetical protein
LQTSDPNNNNLFVTTSQSQQSSQPQQQQQQQTQQATLISLPQTVTQASAIQSNKPSSTVLPSISAQQLNQYQIQQQQQILAQPSNTIQYTAAAAGQIRVSVDGDLKHSTNAFRCLVSIDGSSCCNLSGHRPKPNSVNNQCERVCGKCDVFIGQ